MTYREVLKSFADHTNKTRLFVRVPFSNISLSAYVASLVTPVPAPIVRCLMEGLRDDVACQNERIKTVLPFEPLDYKGAIMRAISREARNEVDTRWSDAYPRDHQLPLKLHELHRRPQYTAHSYLLSAKDAFRLFTSIGRIGGKEGWFHSNWMWRLRGLRIDSCWVSALQEKGHRALQAHQSVNQVGGGQAIYLDRSQDVLLGASDRRKDGCALGY